MTEKRQRMVFECPEEIKRAIRARAGMDGLSPAEVILAAIRAYLPDEIDLANKRIQNEPAPAGQPSKRKSRGASAKQSMDAD